MSRIVALSVRSLRVPFAQSAKLAAHPARYNRASLNFIRHYSGDAEKKKEEEAQALVIVRSKETTWDRFRDRMNEQASKSHVISGILNAKERMRERIEQSDNPIIQKLFEWRESLFGENDQALCIRQIQTTDPTFTIEQFTEDLETSLIPELLSATLKGDSEALRKYCSEETTAALQAHIRERDAAGIIPDSRILNVQRTELSAAALADDIPTLLISCVAQQVNCVRNKEGKILEGAEDDIRAVYYMMAFQYATPEDTGVPRWELTEMVIRGTHETI
eukprot:TRINITY_DN618_c0_g1::TRINITY_DN618_c0_g1_i1::g.28744::m.28744 TRINITY_DN618_c0_g1::TRINITY_DN618_c0_g1_i1::g.28744  ORF type:complete len:297 (+),score=57.26,sp/Q5XF06/TI442_ARATH/30.38/2e-29,Tim44/PF04280.10/5.6e+03,Tim44/PF04280.10/1.8e-29,UBN2_2/PF14227.1/0.033 TRINITY_DN618_c0_g1_i1:63-893(+)